MSSYHFHSNLLVRTPVYSYHNYAETDLGCMLKQPLFKKAIWFASEVFYRELEKAGFDINKLEAKAVNTLKKYVNRMHYRPTPFGLCSAFGILSWGQGTPVSFDISMLRPHIQFSYARSWDLANVLISINEGCLVYYLNNSVYKTGREYRFIRRSSDNVQKEFRIDSLAADNFFDQVIIYLKLGRTKKDIIAWLCLQTSCTIADAASYFQWLIEQQLVCHQLEANITGTDHLERVLESIDQKLSAFDELKRSTHICDLKEGGTLNSADVYLNTEANFGECKLDPDLQQSISDGVNCLALLSTMHEPPSLKRFKGDLVKKFEHQAIPLLQALDPEIGVGYGNLEAGDDDQHLLKDLYSTGNADENVPLTWGKVHSLLLKKWQQNPSIELIRDDFTEIDDNDTLLPQSISVMFRVIGKQVFIEQAGGVSATSLIGRFTPFNDGIHRLAKDMAKHESDANPDIIFAEIAHICHDHTANIDRRKNIYPYEIPVLIQSGLPQQQQIPLNDLWVVMQKDELILWSQKYNKRVVPRLSSAFNYTRNDLAVFRFLCDMQHVGAKTNLGFNLSRFFPGLSYYPRVSYQDTILQLASWNIKQDVLLPAINARVEDRTKVFDRIRTELKLPRYIALTQHDHQLVFDLDLPSEVLFLLDTIKGMPQIAIKEFLLPGKEQSHVNQFIASLYHTGSIYKPLSKSSLSQSKNTVRKLLPGSEWLYLKLYCHPVRANELLQGPLYKFINHCMLRQLTSQWFFIRYADPDHHIRLRLKINTGEHQQVLERALKILAPMVNQGLISKYSIDTYERELERYGANTICGAESVFYASSALVVGFLRKCNPSSAEDVLKMALVSVKDIITAGGLTGEEAINFLERVFTSFFAEFNSFPNLKHQLDTIYRRQKGVIEQVLQDHQLYYHNLQLVKERDLLLGYLHDLDKNEKRLAAIIHMHLNRIFVTDPRKQEMGIYYFLLKHERSVFARQKVKVS